MPTDRTLAPGELAYGGAGTTLKTLLGSCVAVVFWHPGEPHGGMCHYLLPARPAPGVLLDGRYGEDALAVMHQHFQKRGVPPEQVQVSVFGGADVLDELVAKGDTTVGRKNIDTARTLLARLGYRITREEVGGIQGRTVTLQVSTGRITVQASSRQAPRPELIP